MIQTTNLEKVYTMGKASVTALQNCSLHIRKGEQVAVMGKSGSGKSTLLYLLGGLERPTAGTILVNGMPRSVRCIEDSISGLYFKAIISFRK